MKCIERKNCMFFKKRKILLSQKMRLLGNRKCKDSSEVKIHTWCLWIWFSCTFRFYPYSSFLLNSSSLFSLLHLSIFLVVWITKKIDMNHTARGIVISTDWIHKMKLFHETYGQDKEEREREKKTEKEELWAFRCIAGKMTSRVPSLAFLSILIRESRMYFTQNFSLWKKTHLRHIYFDWSEMDYSAISTENVSKLSWHERIQILFEWGKGTSTHKSWRVNKRTKRERESETRLKLEAESSKWKESLILLLFVLSP